MWDRQRVIFRNSQSPGDIIMMTAALRDLHRAYPRKFATDVRTPFPALWENNPHLAQLDERQAGVSVLDVGYDIINSSNDGAYHMIHGFALDIGRQLGVYIPITRLWGDLHLNEEFLSKPSLIKERYVGRDLPYWIICSGGKKDYTAKWWIPEYAQEVVDHFRDKLQFIQVGAVGPNHVHVPLSGVIDIVGDTNLTDLIHLVHLSDGVVSAVSLLMHLAAAVPARPGRPPKRACVVTAGGREPSSFTYYTTHQYLHANGALACASNGGCWKSRIEKLGDNDPKDEELCEDTVPLNGRMVQRCMHDLVTPADVIRAIEKYYIGGSLSYLPAGRKSITHRRHCP